MSDRKETIQYWPKLSRPNGRGLEGYLKNISKDDAATGLDRSIPVSYWCDCAKSNLSYLGSVSPHLMQDRGPSGAFKMVPTNTKTKDNLCAFCGHYAIMRRVRRENWPASQSENGSVGKHARQIRLTDVNTGESRIFLSNAQAKAAGYSSVDYALSQNRPINGKHWTYVDGQSTLKREKTRGNKAPSKKRK